MSVNDFLSNRVNVRFETSSSLGRCSYQALSLSVFQKKKKHTHLQNKTLTIYKKPLTLSKKYVTLSIRIISTKPHLCVSDTRDKQKKGIFFSASLSLNFFIYFFETWRGGGRKHEEEMKLQRWPCADCK